MKLTTAEDLAQAWGLELDKFHHLRRERGWPHLKFGRSDIRFTDEQIAEIVRIQTVRRPPADPSLSRGLPGQTALSRARNRQ